jgi:hypothetical protein
MGDETTLRDRLDGPRQQMYDELAEQLGDAALEDDLQRALHKRVTDLYDNRERIDAER